MFGGFYLIIPFKISVLLSTVGEIRVRCSAHPVSSPASDQLLLDGLASESIPHPGHCFA